ncbi:MAG TPA: cytochrome P460 family protein [Terracidiphilus sp.]|nr:cytochrome P460 family protein [Terracidiphilus sp.]
MARIILAVALAVLPVAAAVGLRGADASQPQVPFPSGYREWVHVKSAVIGPEFPAYATEGGIHHIYANRTALAGFSTGTFNDGSILVYDLLSLSEKNGIGTEGPRRRIDIMVKDSKRYAASGGWGFARFMADDRDHDVLTFDAAQSCYQCHQSRKAQGFVFSEFRR